MAEKERDGAVSEIPAGKPASSGWRSWPQIAGLVGIAWMLLAACGSSVMNAVIRALSSDLHAFEIAFFRNLFGLLSLTPLLLRAGIGSLRTQKLGLHAMRGGLNAIAMLSFFMALGITPLAEVAALGFTAPLFATLLAAFVLGEAVGLRRVLALLAGFAGALVIIRPGFNAISLGAALVLVSSLAWAAALIDIKVLSRTESSLRITVYATLFLTPITLACALPFWRWPDFPELLLLAVVGGLGSLTQMSVAQAFRAADTSQVLPADFTKLIWATLIGWLVFAELPDLWTLGGGCLIFGSVAYIAIREARLRRRPGQIAEKT
jgi:drug/metabolite transporter (DMT)-like permease